eukprot:TRINITY_DN15446_c0_g1_i3.p1 TRINITY_DN15446_c0_g1~~TRINITY_DN15446_c0_g1_i3.p1  ORF type:complete len:305 (+),score=38.98 TRINITY_DN15446_c0_g1_i3:131-1045(+)
MDVVGDFASMDFFRFINTTEGGGFFEGPLTVPDGDLTPWVNGWVPSTFELVTTGVLASMLVCVCLAMAFSCRQLLLVVRQERGVRPNRRQIGLRASLLEHLTPLPAPAAPLAGSSAAGSGPSATDTVGGENPKEEEIQSLRSMECCVCLDVVEEGTPALELPCCPRWYHHECIIAWLERMAVCPMCRRRLTPAFLGIGDLEAESPSLRAATDTAQGQPERSEVVELTAEAHLYGLGPLSLSIENGDGDEGSQAARSAPSVQDQASSSLLHEGRCCSPMTAASKVAEAATEMANTPWLLRGYRRQ